MFKDETQDDEEREYLHKGPCSECGSSDACALYSDGGTHCFSCGHHTRGDGGEQAHPANRTARIADLIDGTATDLRARKLNQETCQKWGYHTGTFKGQPVQIANYRTPDGLLTAQKLRFADKSSMPWLGSQKKAASLYGQWLWKSGGVTCVVTEGELDALSVSQVFGHKWPVVSISRGAHSAHKDVSDGIAFLSSFDRVVFMFDMDDEGQEAAQRCAALLPPGKAYIAQLSEKDASDLLVKGKASEITHATHHAKQFRPDGIVSVADVREAALTPKEMGHAWFIPQMTTDSYGVHPQNVITIGAGTGVGKTDFLAEQIAFQISTQGENVGTIFLETPPEDLLKIIAGKVMDKTFLVPDGSWTREDLTEGIRRLEEGDRLRLYDSWGATDWDTIKATIVHMAVADKCKHIYLDHLTALAALVEDEKTALEHIMAELAGIAQQYDIIIWVVSHLTTPEGKSHEEGGRVTIRHFKGSRSIGFWSHIMIGLERNQQAEDEFERTVTTVRILKYRPYSRCVGNTYRMAYDYTTGRLYPAPDEGEAAGLGFTLEIEDF